MKVLSKNISSSFTIKKSKFLCFAYLVQTKEEIKNIIKQIKTDYSDASHVCYAYILDDNHFYYSDGGEPSGCAGKPIYRGLLSFQLNYVLFIVVRYFGGIKFGTSLLQSTFNELTRNTLKKQTFANAKRGDIVKIYCPFCNIKRLESVLLPYIYEKKYDKDGAFLYLVGEALQIKSLLTKLNIEPIEILNTQIIKVK